MKRNILNEVIILACFGLFFMGCGSPKMLVSHRQVADEQVNQGNYAAAVESWKLHFGQQPLENTTGNEFAAAAYAAWKAGDITQAVSWFDQARYKQFSSERMTLTLAAVYRDSDNLSKELDALEYYVGNYTERSDSVYGRLYEIYIGIDATDKALEVWTKMDEPSRQQMENMDSWFQIHRMLGDSVLCDSVSLVILERDPAHVQALEWNAQKYYQLAESRYQREMDSYNSNKTTKQYRILVKELELTTADFKRALVYFDKLWKITPGKKYAGHLANIYARFGDEKKSQEYRKYLDGK